MEIVEVAVNSETAATVDLGVAKFTRELVKKMGKTSDKQLGQMEEILQLMQRENLQELEICDGPFRVKLVRQFQAAIPTMAAPVPAAPAQRKKEAKAEESYGTATPIKSPLAGVFYRAPSPQAPPFVKEGDFVSPDKTVCIVEAMKVLNQINAGVTGRIVKIAIENGKPIQTGQVLFLVEPQ